jgi:hypothetical protein
VQREEQLLKLTVEGLQTSLDRHMPPSEYRDFYHWAISHANPYREEFLQAQGITQLVRMTCQLVHGLVSDSHWNTVARYTIPMNVYQIYEIVSDNLAIGMAKANAGDAAHTVRRTLLHEFNRVMGEKLRGDPRPAQQMLNRSRILTQRVSQFKQSLNPQKQRFFAHVYLEYHHVSAQALEFSTWPVLVANIESCVDLAQLMTPYQSGELITQGLVNRYRAVNYLLKQRSPSQKSLLQASTHAILVIPTLAYYIAVLGEVVQSQTHFEYLIRTKTLANALFEAALLVRLLNDLGTWTLRLTPEQHQALATVLKLKYGQQDAPDFVSGLASAIQDAHVLTRVFKDLQHEEFNIALHRVRTATFHSEAITMFTDTLANLSQVYLKHYQRLQNHLMTIDNVIGQDWLSKLILRFVQFHETLYSNPYDVENGEYSV